ncbi:dihydropteroate synthase [Herbiconiux moechotypicola]|uniref:Dihydropteroate synthase n=1 Tax=Herbiconiux moechotypicola TaxID=637393 RepID=A0ABN3E4G7_9MICO|nr:dihydropteroate synthase [Herbiconiux moechotypicola]MCS5731617.1 dihydropteroate synthase [Herbiconiux moechotypicola]
MTEIMGILNVTPDSFSDGGHYTDRASAVRHAEGMVARGATIIDVGGESTRPGAARVAISEEQRRVLPVVRELVARGITVSVDTMNASTAAAAIEAGAAIINDVSGGLADPEMDELVVASGVRFVVMHWRGHSEWMQQAARYDDVVSEVAGELELRAAQLIVKGVSPDRLVLDPGIGFAKTAEHNWSLLGHLGRLTALGLPLLVGASRKRFLGELEPGSTRPGDRDLASAVVAAFAAREGAWGVRVHDIDSTRQALGVARAWQSGAQS